MKQIFRSFLSWLVLLLIVVSGTVFFWLVRDSIELFLVNIGIENSFHQYFAILGGAILIIILIKIFFLKNISVIRDIKKIFKP